MESMVLRFDAGMLDHGAGVGLQARHGTSDMSVDFDDFFDRGCFEEGGGDAFFDAEDHTGASGDLGGYVSWGIKVEGRGLRLWLLSRV